ncbi:3-dehydroquinate synthase [Ulvibacterium marinum]|uniref:3-dehydroquinate synthase n=1 Tax=Ulvibacterium marinum TaxID=2419782 RepID=A0A3B0C8M2_9FLAO|nr:3-dehydroquinate synthase [Ulvibacterium marinum]RKN80981.1 3-dehydroquinate synthase [Ulvibacterium marinum]
MESIITSSYSVHFNQKAYDALDRYLSGEKYSKIFILVDENTRKHCLTPFRNGLRTEFTFEVLEIESGEENKNIHTCVKVWNALSELDGDRKSLLINLGGGVLCDLGGFAASTFKRGIDFINVPTTLLSMVDASVGGKTGVDLGSLKNQIGVINQPRMVLILSDFLKTLEERQLQSGFAEMLKHGLIQDASYWDTLKSVSDFKAMDTLIHTSVVIKNNVVLQDPREQNVRKILNFGHTLGHAIESYFLESEAHETLLHGESIAIGMILEAYLSFKLTGLPKNQLEDIKTVFLSKYPKPEFQNTDIESILTLLKFDKKNAYGTINFVLLKHIGEPVVDVRIPEDLFHSAFSYFKE